MSTARPCVFLLAPARVACPNSTFCGILLRATPKSRFFFFRPCWRLAAGGAMCVVVCESWPLLRFCGGQFTLIRCGGKAKPFACAFIFCS
jgi:hypothetical protein